MGINPWDMLKNAQMMQERMTALQEKLAAMTVIGSAGGGMATVEMDGKMEVRAVHIMPECFDSPDPKNDIPIVEDLVKAALHDAMAKVRETVNAELAGATGGMNLPPGFPGL